VSGDARARQLPGVPTLAEAGFPGLKFVTWNGLMAPGGTRRDIVERIAAATMLALKDKEFAERFAEVGIDALGSTPEEFAATIAADVALWGDAVRSAGIAAK